MELRHTYDWAILLNYMKLARSSFYYHAKQLDKADKYADIKAMIKNIHEQHERRLGYRRITLLLRQQSQLINHKTVLRLIRRLGAKKRSLE